MIDAGAVETAAEVLRPVVRRTELEHSVRLSDLLMQESEVRERVGLSEPALVGGRLALPVLNG